MDGDNEVSYKSLVLRDPFNWPPTRLSAWRVRSRWTATYDALVIAAGTLLIAITIIDSVATWPSNLILITPKALERMGGVLLLLTWPWILLSAAMLFGTTRSRQLKIRGWLKRARWVNALLAFLLICCAAAIVGGAVIGWDKGSVRILSNGHYQVSDSSNKGTWTTVSEHIFRFTEAQFLRGDSTFSLFGLAMVAFGVLMFRIRMRVKDSG